MARFASGAAAELDDRPGSRAVSLRTKWVQSDLEPYADHADHSCRSHERTAERLWLHHDISKSRAEVECYAFDPENANQSLDLCRILRKKCKSVLGLGSDALSIANDNVEAGVLQEFL